MNWQGLGFAVEKWVLWNSAGAAAVAVLVLVVQKLWRDRISARWRHNLWTLVAVRLMLPAIPGIAISMPQWLKPAQQPKIAAVAPRQQVVNPIAVAWPEVRSKAGSPREQPIGPATVQPIDAADEQPAFEAKSFEPAAKPEFFEAVAQGAPLTASPVIATGQAFEKVTAPPDPAIWALSWKFGGLAVWLLGVFLMLARVAFNTFQLRRLTRAFQPVDDAGLHGMLADCCRQTRIKRPPVLVKGPSAFGPALIGLCRPRLILPDRVLKEFGRHEIRAILLHELIHLRRRDVAINYLIALLQAAHWFNPLIWLAFSKIRAERELACDEAVLALSPARERLSYGCTILKLLESLCDTATPAGAVGVVQQKGLVQRRINMIARFNGERTGRPVTAMLMSVLVGGASLTATTLAQDKPVEAAPKLAAPSPAVNNARAAVEAAAGQKPESGPVNIAPPALPEPAAAPPVLPVPAPPAPNGPPGLPPPEAANSASEPVQPPPPASKRRSEESGPRADFSPRTIEDASAAIADAKTAEQLKHTHPLDAHGLPLREVLNMIADVGKVDIVIDDQALANAGVDPNIAVNIRLKDPRPLEQILEMSLRLASPQVDYTILDGVIFVTSSFELNTRIVTRVYKVGDVDHRAISTLLTNGTGLVSQVSFVGDNLVVTASELTQRHVAKLLSAVADQMNKSASSQNGAADETRRTIVYSLRYADAKDLKALLEMACTPGESQIVADQRTNSLVVNARERDLKVADDVVQKLDHPSTNGDRTSGALPNWVGQKLESLRDLSEKAVAKRMQVGSRNPEYLSLSNRIQVVESEIEGQIAQLDKDGNEPAATHLKRQLDQIVATFSENAANDRNNLNPEEINRLTQEIVERSKSLDEMLSSRPHDDQALRRQVESLKLVKSKMEAQISELGNGLRKSGLEGKIKDANAVIGKFEKQQSGAAAPER